MKKKFNILMIAASLCLLTLPLFSQQVAKTIPYPASPDGVIGFLEFRPSDYGTQKHPLIIFLHGWDERGNGTTNINSVSANAIPKFCAAGATMRFTVNGQTSSFVVLSPQLSTQYGLWPSFYVKEMIKYAKANLQIDSNRIYVTGLSLGGGGVWKVATDNSNYSFDAGIAAIAPICGTQDETDAEVCNTIAANHLPVWAFHCMDDGTVNVGATQHAQILLNNCNMTPVPKFTYYQSGGHGGAWDNAYDTGHITRTVVVNGVSSSFTASPNLYEWFLSNSRFTNQPPVVNPGENITVTLPNTTGILDGSDSYDLDGTIVSSVWTQVSAPGGSYSPIANSSGITTTVGNLIAGTYVFSLKVTDNSGVSSTSNKTVTVVQNSGSNQPPIAITRGTNIIALPNTVALLDGSSSYDLDGSIVSYLWTQVSAPANAYSPLGNTTGVSTTVNNLIEGTYVFSLKVTDNSGVSSTSYKTITVVQGSGGNQPPLAIIGSTNIIALPNNVAILDGSSSYDPDGGIVSYLWTQVSAPNNSNSPLGSTTSVSTTVNNLVEGMYVFSLKVTDNTGATHTTNKIIVVTNSLTNQAPTAIARGTNTVILPNNSAILDGSGSYDADGSIVSYHWEQATAPDGSYSPIGNTSAAKTTVYNLIAGTYMFKLTVTDNNNVVSSPVIKIVTVYPSGTQLANQAPIALDGATAIVTLPTNSVALDGAQSYDPDGNIVSYNWSQASAPNGAYSPIGNVSSASTTVTNLIQGTYLFILRVTDNYGSVSTTTKVVQVKPAAGSGLRLIQQKTIDTDTSRLIDAGLSATIGKPGIYPNPAPGDATLQLISADNSVKTINLYNSAGVLLGQYKWTTTKGENTFLLKNVNAFGKGLYIVEIRDSKGGQIARLKFVKS